MHGTGNHFLSSSAFAGDKYGEIRCGGLADGLENILHFLAFADNGRHGKFVYFLNGFRFWWSLDSSG